MMTATTTTIEIAKDYTPFLGGRWRKDGPGSGEEFREDFLSPRLKAGVHIIVTLAGAYGYPISFLEEAFGGLLREGFTVDQLKTQLEIKAGNLAFEGYVSEIWRLIAEQDDFTKAKIA